MKESIDEKVELLETINTQISDLEKLLQPLIDKDYNKLMNVTSPKERIDLNWSLSYSTYSLYYLLLKINNIDPNHHQIKDELKRLEDLHKKMKEVEKESDGRQTKINIEAADRMIKNSLSEDADKEMRSKRRLRGNVPEPEMNHLNLNNFK